MNPGMWVERVHPILRLLQKPDYTHLNASACTNLELSKCYYSRSRHTGPAKKKHTSPPEIDSKAEEHQTRHHEWSTYDARHICTTVFSHKSFTTTTTSNHHPEGHQEHRYTSFPSVQRQKWRPLPQHHLSSLIQLQRLRTRPRRQHIPHPSRAIGTSNPRTTGYHLPTSLFPRSSALPPTLPGSITSRTSLTGRLHTTAP